MRAIVITEPGGPEVLQIQELPEPIPGEGDVLIRVEAFGVYAGPSRRGCSRSTRSPRRIG